MTTPRAVCLVDLDALAHNLREVRRWVGPEVRICAVVKANAYGHGALPVSRALLRAGADAFAVACFEEAQELRDAGVSAPILVLQGIDPALAAEASRLGLTPVVWEADRLRALVAALPDGARMTVHLKVDTGMQRIGARPADLPALVRTAHDLGLEVEGILSHLACADEPGHPSIDMQRVELERALDGLAGEGFRPRLRHLANSAGVLADPRTHLDMVRAGLVLYGCLPHPSLAGRVDLRPVMELRTRVLQVKTAAADTGVGYGWTYRPARAARLAVLGIGYAQGYPRALSNHASVLVRGRLAPVAGTISMDHITIDVSEVPDVAVDDEVILWGGCEPAAPRVMQLGEAAGTIGYELLVRVGASVPRVYRSTDS